MRMRVLEQDRKAQDESLSPHTFAFLGLLCCFGVVIQISIDRLEEEGKKINKEAASRQDSFPTVQATRRELLAERILKLLLRPLITQQDVYTAFNTDAPFSISWNDVSYLCDVVGLVKGAEVDLAIEIQRYRSFSFLRSSLSSKYIHVYEVWTCLRYLYSSQENKGIHSRCIPLFCSLFPRLLPAPSFLSSLHVFFGSSFSFFQVLDIVKDDDMVLYLRAPIKGILLLRMQTSVFACVEREKLKREIGCVVPDSYRWISL